MLQMFNKAFILLLLLFGFNSTFSQHEVSKTEKLAATAKIWGFLKYYHPNVASGEFNWDNQLFIILPRIEQASSKEELSNVFIDWLDSLGKVKLCKSCSRKESGDYFDKNFNLSWTQDLNMFTAALSDKLRLIKNNRFQGKHYYVGTGKGAKNIIINNEHLYENFDWENKNLRLLALFRYWNTIEYFFPYKYQTDQNWNLVLKEMIPKFLAPKSELDYHLTMLELVVKIDDSHAGLTSKVLNRYFGDQYIPALYTIIADKAVLTRFYNDSLAQLNDLRIGDAITKVNGTPILDIYHQKRLYIQGSNHTAKLAFSWNKIFNGSSDSVEIEFLRDNKLSTKKIGRYYFEDFNYERPVKEKWKILENNIGYVDMGQVEREDIKGMMDNLMPTNAIIFDIRNYPKGTMYGISNYLNSSTKEFVKITEPDLNYPGRFKWAKPLICGNRGKQKYTGKVILLVNERTISHAEFTAMCLQTADDVTTIGSQTLAADGNVSQIGFVGGFKTRMSGTGIFYPDETETQRVGIRLDIEVLPTIEGMQKGKDEVLEKAINISTENTVN